RAELESLGGPAGEIAGRLSPAKDLTRRAAEQLRAAIYSLHHVADEAPGPLHPECEQAMLRWTGEALFNAAAHGKATRALIRLRYLAGAVAISVSDDGTGDPAQLRRALRLSSGGDLSGLHRGLANMRDMADGLGGTLSIRGSRSGGVFLRLDIPLPWPERRAAGRRQPTEGCGGDA